MTVFLNGTKEETQTEKEVRENQTNQSSTNRWQHVLLQQPRVGLSPVVVAVSSEGFPLRRGGLITGRQNIGQSFLNETTRRILSLAN